MCHYPKRILPKLQYAQRINVDGLKAANPVSMLVRRLDCVGNPFHCIGGRKLLNEGVIDNDVLDWSTNLLGGEYKIEDIRWRQKGERNTEWNEGDVDINEYGNCYEYLDDANPIYIPVGKLHQISIPYKRKFGSKADAYKYAITTQDLDEEVAEQFLLAEDIECHATIKVEHKPTVLNYWHMTIGIIPRDFQEPIPRNTQNNKSLKKRVKAALHLHIVNNVQIDYMDSIKLPESLYIKNPT